MLILMKGIILLKYPVSIYPSVSVLSKLLFCASYHVLYVAWNKFVNIYELVDHSYITIFLGWLHGRTCI